jgi:thioredoxin-like negative regulator of GroEL
MQMSPIVDGLEQKYGQAIAVRRVNANLDDGPAIMRAYRLQGHPTTLIFDRQGQEVQRLLGPQPAETVAEILDETLAGEP